MAKNRKKKRSREEAPITASAHPCRKAGAAPNAGKNQASIPPGESKNLSNIKNSPTTLKKNGADDECAPATKKRQQSKNLESRQGKEADGTLAENSRKGVSALTCIAGMFLTLLLGLYLGSLLPGILADLSGKNAAPDQTDVLQMQQSTSSAPAANKETPPARTRAAMSEQEPATVPKKISLAPASLPALLQPDIAPDAQRHIEELIKKTSQNPDDASAWIHLANLYFDTNQHRKAIASYDRALALKPDNPDALTDQGIMYREIGEFNLAVERFRKASALNPQHLNSLYNEGVVLAYDLHKNDEAKEAWQKLLRLNPEARAPNGTPLKEMMERLH